MLIEAGADFQSREMNDNNDKPWSRIPIVQAAGCGYQDCVRVLLEHGADPNAYSQQGSALYVAITEGPHINIEICRMLLGKGANLNQSAADNEVYIGRRMLLIRAIATNNEELVSLLLEKGAIVYSVDPTEEYHDTPLSYAVTDSTIRMVELLVRWGADVNFVSEHEFSMPPLCSVTKRKPSDTSKHKFIDLLVNHGANVNQRRKFNGYTALLSHDSPTSFLCF